MNRCICFLAVLLLTAAISPAATPLQTAQHQFEDGKYAEAAATLRAALAQAPQDSLLHHWLARCYYELHEFDIAIGYEQQAVKLDPQNSEYHMWLGRVYGGKAEANHSFSLARKVKQEFEEAVRLNGENITARRDLMEFYLEAPWILGGGSGKARQQAEAIAALNKMEGHLAMGQYRLSEKKPELAEKEYLRALDLKPKNIEPYLEVAGFYLKRRDGIRTEQVLDMAAQVNPSDGRLAYYRGAARILERNRLAEAEQLLKTYLAGPARSDFPSHASAREWLGQLYEQQGRRKEAAEQYRAALKLEPDLDEARAGLRRLEKP
jgi:cytochrome c-type biogenesis protein CcmH/NrfG